MYNRDRASDIKLPFGVSQERYLPWSSRTSDSLFFCINNKDNNGAVWFCWDTLYF